MAGKEYSKDDIKPLKDFKWCYHFIVVDDVHIRSCELGNECECD